MTSLDGSRSSLSNELVASSASQRNWRGIMIALLIITILMVIIVLVIMIVTPEKPKDNTDTILSIEEALQRRKIWDKYSIARPHAGGIIQLQDDGGGETTMVRLLSNGSVQPLILPSFFRQHDVTDFEPSPATTSPVDARPKYVLLSIDSTAGRIFVVYDVINERPLQSLTEKVDMLFRKKRNVLSPSPTSAPGGALLSNVSRSTTTVMTRPLWMSGSNGESILAFSASRDVYTYTVEANSLQRQTNTPSGSEIYSGSYDWTYQNELAMGSSAESAMWANGNLLVYLQSDDSNVSQHRVPLYGRPDRIVRVPLQEDLTDVPKTEFYILDPVRQAQTLIPPPTVSSQSTRLLARNAAICHPSASVSYVATTYIDSHLRTLYAQVHKFSAGPLKRISAVIRVEIPAPTRQSWLSRPSPLSFSPDCERVAFSLPVQYKANFHAVYHHLATFAASDSSRAGLEMLTQGEYNIASFQFSDDGKSLALEVDAAGGPPEKTGRRVERNVFLLPAAASKSTDALTQTCLSCDKREFSGCSWFQLLDVRNGTVSFACKSGFNQSTFVVDQQPSVEKDGKLRRYAVRLNTNTSQLLISKTQLPHKRCLRLAASAPPLCLLLPVDFVSDRPSYQLVLYIHDPRDGVNLSPTVEPFSLLSTVAARHRRVVAILTGRLLPNDTTPSDSIATQYRYVQNLPYIIRTGTIIVARGSSVPALFTMFSKLEVSHAKPTDDVLPPQIAPPECIVLDSAVVHLKLINSLYRNQYRRFSAKTSATPLSPSFSNLEWLFALDKRNLHFFYSARLTLLTASANERIPLDHTMLLTDLLTSNNLRFDLQLIANAASTWQDEKRLGDLFNTLSNTCNTVVPEED